MHEELVWGLPVILDLFMAGAGAMTVSASVLLRGGGGRFGGDHFALARYGALIAPLPVMVGCGLLIFELGSFEAGHWFKWINLYLTINLSPMSIGTWLLTFFIGVSVLYAFTFVPRDAGPGDRLRTLREAMAWIGVPLGIDVNRQRREQPMAPAIRRLLGDAQGPADFGHRLAPRQVDLGLA